LTVIVSPPAGRLLDDGGCELLSLDDGCCTDDAAELLEVEACFDDDDNLLEELLDELTELIALLEDAAVLPELFELLGKTLAELEGFELGTAELLEDLLLDDETLTDEDEDEVDDDAEDDGIIRDADEDEIIGIEIVASVGTAMGVSGFTLP